MLLHRKLLLSFAVLGLALSAPRAEAAFLVIDDFNDAISAPPDATDTITVVGISTTRVSTVTEADTMTSEYGSLTISGDNPVIGEITWKPVSGSDSFDLSPNFAFALDIIGVAEGTWTAKVFASDGTNSDDVDQIANSGTKLFYFSQFIDENTLDPVSFSALKEIRLTLTDSTGSTITLGQIRAVPEPSTAGMLMLGLFGLARMGRSRKLAA